MDERVRLVSGIGKAAWPNNWYGDGFPFQSSGPPDEEMITSVSRNNDLAYQEMNAELIDRLVLNVTPMLKRDQDRGVCGRVKGCG